MVIEHSGDLLAVRRDRLEDPCADADVVLHQRHLLVGEASRLVEDLVGDADLSHVMQQGTLVEHVDLALVVAVFLGQR